MQIVKKDTSEIDDFEWACPGDGTTQRCGDFTQPSCGVALFLCHIHIMSSVVKHNAFIPVSIYWQYWPNTLYSTILTKSDNGSTTPNRINEFKRQ